MPFSLPAAVSSVGLPGGTVPMPLSLQTMGPGVGLLPLSLLAMGPGADLLPLSLLAMVPGVGIPDGTVVHTLRPGEGTTWQQCTVVSKTLLMDCIHLYRFQSKEYLLTYTHICFRNSNIVYSSLKVRRINT